MLKSIVCNYSDICILVKETRTITVVGENVAATQDTDERNKQVIFKNCAPSIDCMIKLNNMQVNNARDMDVVMSMYSLI